MGITLPPISIGTGGTAPTGGLNIPGIPGGIPQNYLNLLLLLLGGTSGAFGTPSSSNTKSTGTTGSNITGSTTANQTATSTPTLDEAGQTIESQLSPVVRQLLGFPMDLSGYTSSGIDQINRNADLQRQSIDAIMASRGLSTSPISATAALIADQNRLNQISDFQNSIPLLRNQLLNTNLSSAISALGATPRGITSSGNTSGSNVEANTGTSSSDSNTTGSTGGGIGGALGGLGTILGYLLASGLGNAGGKTGSNTSGNTASGNTVNIYIDPTTGRIGTTSGVPPVGTIPISPDLGNIGDVEGIRGPVYHPPTLSEIGSGDPSVTTRINYGDPILGSGSGISNYPIDPTTNLPIDPNTGIPFIPDSTYSWDLGRNGTASENAMLRSNLATPGLLQRTLPTLPVLTSSSNPFAGIPNAPKSISDAISNFGFTPMTGGGITGSLNGTPTNIGASPNGMYAPSLTPDQIVSQAQAALQQRSAPAANPVNDTIPINPNPGAPLNGSSSKPNPINPGTLSHMLAGLF